MTVDQSTPNIYMPSPEILASAIIQDYDAVVKHAREDLAGFWAEQAQEFVWFKEWDQVLDESDKPFYKWFVGGKTNIVYNCLDRHVKTWRRNKLALIWEGRRWGGTRPFPTTRSTARSASSPTCCAAWGSRRATG